MYTYYVYNLNSHYVYHMRNSLPVNSWHCKHISFDPGPTAEDINLPLEYLKQLPCGDDYLSTYYLHFNIISRDNNLALHFFKLS